MKVIKVILNILHILYCMVCFVSLDFPFLMRLPWHLTILYYIFTMPLFIWGIYRLCKEYEKENKECEE